MIRSIPSGPAGDEESDRHEVDLLEVIYEMAVSSLEQVLSLIQGDFLA